MRSWRTHRTPSGRKEAAAPAAALDCKGPSGYAIAADHRSITFRPCGTTSHNPKDVENRYCGRCHRFVGELSARHDTAPADRQQD